MAKSLFPIALGGRINVYTSVTLSLTKLAFTYASNIVRWVWKCPRHSGTMLSAVAVLAPGQLEYDRDRGLNLAWFPLYRLLPTAPLFAMADGQYGTDEVPIVLLRRRNLRLSNPENAATSASIASLEGSREMKRSVVSLRRATSGNAPLTWIAPECPSNPQDRRR